MIAGQPRGHGGPTNAARTQYGGCAGPARITDAQTFSAPAEASPAMRVSMIRHDNHFDLLKNNHFYIFNNILNTRDKCDRLKT